MIRIVAGSVTALVGVMVWYLKYQTKRQAEREDKHDKIQEEERKFNRAIITNELKSLHTDNMKNSDLNNQSLVLLRGIGNNQRKLCKLIEGVDKRINGRK